MSVSLSPIFNGWQGFTAGGLPLNAGTINTYAAGGTTPQATYTDHTGGTPCANPIVLDATGRPTTEIWLTDGQSYRFDLSDALGNLIKTYDYITGGSVSLGVLAASSGSSLVGFIQAGTGAVSRTVQSKERDIINAADYGFSTAATASVNTAAIMSAFTYLGTLSAGGDVFLGRGTFAVDPFQMPATLNLGLVGAGSGRGYGNPTPATTLQFTTGTTGILQSTTYGSAGPYSRFKDFQIDGNSVITNGLNVLEQMDVEGVTVKNTTGAGFFCQDMNQAFLTNCTAVNNAGDGLSITVSSAGTTVCNISRCNFRSNTGNGVTIKDGTHVNWYDCVFESNSGFGIYIYAPTGVSIDHHQFYGCWAELNGATDANTSYNIVIDSQANTLASAPSFIDFYSLRSNQAGRTVARHIHFINAQQISFVKPDFLIGDQANALIFGTTAHVGRIIFWDRNGGQTSINALNSTCADMKANPGSSLGGLQTDGFFTDFSRTYPMGWSVAYTPSVTGLSSMTTVVSSATGSYAMWGLTARINFTIQGTIGGTPSGDVLIAIPTALPDGQYDGAVWIFNNGAWSVGYAFVVNAGTTIHIQLTPAAGNWTAGTYEIRGQFVFGLTL